LARRRKRSATGENVMETPVCRSDGEQLPTSPKSDSEIFLEFHYPELKDLGKHFLTLVSGVLAFFVAFADRLLNLSKATLTQKVFLILALSFLIISVVAVGTGIYINFIAGGRVHGSIIRGKGGDFKPLVRRTYWLYHVGGAAFVLALCLLAAIAALKFV
jgi:hypothetical protein